MIFFPSVISSVSNGQLNSEKFDADPGLTQNHGKFCVLYVGKQDFTEAIDNKIFLGRKGRVDLQVEDQRLFVMAGAFWVAQKLHSVVTDDGLHGTCYQGLQSLGCKGRPAAQPVLLNSSLYHSSTQQDETGDNKLLLHLEKLFCISTHLPYPLFSPSKAQII